MPGHDLSALVRDAFDAWNAHDADRLAAFAAEDVVIEGDALGAPIRGRDGYRHFARSYMDAFPDLHFEIRDPLVVGDRCVVEWRATGTHRGSLMGIPGTGRMSVLNGCAILQFRDGLIVADHPYWDNASMLRQLGLMPVRAVESPAIAMDAIPR